MSTRVLGIGLGLFLLSILWSLAILVYLLTGKAKSPYSALGPISLLLVSIITGILLLMPRAGHTYEHIDYSLPKHGKLPSDPTSIWRLCILIINIISALAAMATLYLKWIAKRNTRLRVLKLEAPSTMDLSKESSKSKSKKASSKI